VKEKRMPEKGDTIISREGEHRGKATGTRFKCRLAGCNGMRITVKWPDGKVTFPCSRGLKRSRAGWQIC